MTYSIDLRNSVLRYLLNKPINITIKEIATMFNVNRSTIYRWILLKKNNRLVPLKLRKKKINIRIKFFIRDYVIKKTNFCYKSLLKLLKNKFNLEISKTLLYKTLKELKISRKKIYNKPIYSNKHKRNREIKELRNKLKNVNVNDIISIDETSIDTHISHNYGWSKKGIKITNIKRNLYKRYTIICAISNKKIIHYQVIPKSANGELFLSFIQTLISKLDGNKYLLMDNARIHHYSKVKEVINNNRNIKLIYNVPYSPEYNPIEYVFNEFKNKLKKQIITNKNIFKKIRNSFKIKSNNLMAYFNKSLKDLYIL